MGRKKSKMSEQAMMDGLAMMLLEDAIESCDDEALDLLEKCLVPTGGPPVPWRGIVMQARQKLSQGEEPTNMLIERGRNRRFVPMVI